MAITGDLLGAAATCLAMVNFAFISWGVKKHFVGGASMPSGMRVVTVLTLASFAWFVWARTAGSSAGGPRIPGDLVGSALLASDMALFWWAVHATRVCRLTLAFSRDQPTFLNEAGPYAWVRHPFYVSYVLFWVGTAVMSTGWAYWFVPAVMAAIYARAAQVEEAKFSSSQLAVAYERYRDRTAVRSWLHVATRTRIKP